MITGVFGLPGAGKSTFLAFCAACALAGKSLNIGHLFWKTSMQDFSKYERVYSNYPIEGCYKLDTDKIGIFEFSNCLILIDEIACLWSNRNWKNFSADVSDFISLHRHFNVDIIYCGQSYRDCDLKIRERTENVMHIEASHIPGFTKITPLHKFMDVVNCQIAEGYEPANALGVTRINRKKFYSMFDSYEKPALKPLNDVATW